MTERDRPNGEENESLGFIVDIDDEQGAVSAGASGDAPHSLRWKVRVFVAVSIGVVGLNVALMLYGALLGFVVTAFPADISPTERRDSLVIGFIMFGWGIASVAAYFLLDYCNTTTRRVFGVACHMLAALAIGVLGQDAPVIDFHSVPLTPWLTLAGIATCNACLLLFASRLIEYRKTHPALCAGCGYDLTGNTSGKCPECGDPAEVRA